MNRMLATFALLVVVLSTACAPEEVGKLISETSSPQSGADSGTQVDLLSEGIGPLEITPGPGGNAGQGNEGNIDSSGDGSSGNISSSGQADSEGNISDSAGSLESSAPGGGAAGEPEPVSGWATFQEDEFKFSISYPDAYVILPEIELLKNIDQTLVYRVRFQDKQLAEADTADLELPQFSVEVYEDSIETLEGFIKGITPGVNYEEFRIGDLTGYRVFTDRLIAPNEYYYFLGHGYIYKLTPLGKYSQEMLESFRLLP